MSDPLKTAIADGVLTITFARPEKKNALTNMMYKAWADAMEAAAGDPEVRVILFKAEGDAFTSGNDIMDFAQFAAGAVPFGEMQVARVLKALAYAEKPLVAAVTGLAVGVGTTMLLHCDVVMAAEDAKLSTPFVNLALVPEAASSLLLPQQVGAKRAYAMFALGEAISGKQAAALGLATAALPKDAVGAAALRAAQHLARQPAAARAATKRLMRDAGAIAALMDREGEFFTQQLLSAEAREAFSAFLERRPPNFAAVG
jgi:enoyl-CoA hydratase/carnithine racemase